MLRGLRIRIAKGRRDRRLLVAFGVVLAAIFGVALWLFLPFWHLSGQFTDQPVHQPSRLYGRSTLLAEGAYLRPESLIGELDELGYRPAPSGSAGTLARGAYRRDGSTIAVHLRSFPTPNGIADPALLTVRLAGRRIERLELGGERVKAALLEPPLVASYYGDDLKERRPIALAEAPPHLVKAVLAAEDDHFYRHSGVSLRGILRALWANARGGGVSQGGSTLTQQLVKNLYLTHERTVSRKAREGVLALLLEARYSKEQILQAYLNEIYLGWSGGVSLIGVGAASRAIFGKEPAELDLAEAATLAGMIPSPARYSPLADPEAARRRRDLVLDRLAELEWVPAGEIEAARARAIELRPLPPVHRRAPYFADAALAEAVERFGISTLADTGHSLLSTLSWRDQRHAAEAVGWGVEALEEGWEKGSKVAGPLQAALVSVDPRDGGILAYVGGRDYGESQFDRAGRARRQAGSAFKPVVYAAAFEAGALSPATLVEDQPLTVALAGQRWAPQNDDRDFRGWVTVRTAVESSLNVPTARVALEIGLPVVVDQARAMGVSAPLEPVPALALGAFEVTPVEMATIYATLAAGGVRPPAHALVAAFDRAGRPIPGSPLPAPRRAMAEQSAYLVTSILEGVLDRGTARVVRQWGLDDRLAGKTGTTNGRRDSWFGGYSPDRATAVWVGYDDNSSTRLSGGRAALPIWSRFVVKVRPPTGYPVFRPPPGVTTAVIDRQTGELATDACPDILTEVFRTDGVPEEICHLHGRWRQPLDPRYRVEEGNRLKRWLRRVLGRRSRDGG